MRNYITIMNFTKSHLVACMFNLYKYIVKSHDKIELVLINY